MRSFRDIPIQQKLVFVTLLTSVVAFLLATAPTVLTDATRLRHAMMHELGTQTAMLGASCASALATDHPGKARKILSGLEARPEIVQGWLYTTSGVVFTDYLRTGASAAMASPAPQANGSRLD